MALQVTVLLGDREVEVEGTPTALRQLATLIQSPAEVSIGLASGRVNLGPFRGFARSITVRPNERKVRIERQDDQLLLSGTWGAREVLAANLNDFAQGPYEPGDHLHVEFFPGHAYLDEGSLPLVFSRPAS